MSERKIRVSASRLKTLKECSLKFYYENIVHLPDAGHHKARQGDCVHALFELFMAPKRRKILAAILQNGLNPADYPSIARYIRFYDRAHQIGPYEMEAMEGMMVVAFAGIRPYFINAAGEFAPPPECHSEYEFHLWLGEAEIKGYIDLLLVWPDRAVVMDLKSQKAKFTQADVPNNIQAAIYQLACYRKSGFIPAVEFVLLRHAPSKRYPKLHIQRVEAPSLPALLGLEMYLEHMYHGINQFTLEDACVHPHDSLTFCQKVCRFYAPFTYWAVLKDGELVTTHLNDQVTLQEGETLVRREHAGCLMRWRG